MGNTNTQQSLIRKLTTGVVIKLFWLVLLAQGLIITVSSLTSLLTTALVTFATTIVLLYVVVRMYTRELLKLLDEHPQYGRKRAVRRVE